MGPRLVDPLVTIGCTSAALNHLLRGRSAVAQVYALRHCDGIAENITAAAERILIDTTVIAGSRDVVEPVDVLRQHLEPFISKASIHVLDGPGHLIPLEAPEALASELAQYRLNFAY